MGRKADRLPSGIQNQNTDTNLQQAAFCQYFQTTTAA